MLLYKLLIGLNMVKAYKAKWIIPAKILRLNNLIGSLEIDKNADFNVFEPDNGEDCNSILNKKPKHL